MKHLALPFTWAWGELREKLDVRATVKEIKSMWAKYGWRFGAFAVAWEIFEDVICPAIAWKLGFPWLAPLFWIFHFEPLSYPAAFWCFRTYDRFMGREPWDPPRYAKSQYHRSTLKVLTHEIPVILATVAMALLGISTTITVTYAVLMLAAGFFHERIWHDTNYGINIATDMVDDKRNRAKTGTFRVLSISLLGMAFCTLTPYPLFLFLLVEAFMAVAYYVIEWGWSKSAYGIEFKPEFYTQNEGGVSGVREGVVRGHEEAHPTSEALAPHAALLVSG